MNERDVLLNFVNYGMTEDPRVPLNFKGHGEVPYGDVFKYYRCLPKIKGDYRRELEDAMAQNCHLFSAELIRFGKKKGTFCVKNILTEASGFLENYPVFHIGHIWVQGNVESIPDDIKFGDRIKFTGDIYLYRRDDGNYDYGIKNFEFREKDDDKFSVIEAFDKTRDAWLEQQTCEMCLWYEKCPLTVCVEREFFDLVFPRLWTADVLSCVYNAYMLTWSDLKHLYLKPDKLEDLRDFLQGWKYGTLTGIDRMMQFSSYFCRTQEDWLKYMQDRGYTEDCVYAFYEGI